jgi:hypothetical protein
MNSSTSAAYSAPCRRGREAFGAAPAARSWRRASGATQPARGGGDERQEAIRDREQCGRGIDAETKQRERRSNTGGGAMRNTEQCGKCGTAATAPAPRVAPVRHRPSRDVPCPNTRPLLPDLLPELPQHGTQQPNSPLARCFAGAGRAERRRRVGLTTGGKRRITAAGLVGRHHELRLEAKNRDRRTRRRSSRTRVVSDARSGTGPRSAVTLRTKRHRAARQLSSIDSHLDLAACGPRLDLGPSLRRAIHGFR